MSRADYDRLPELGRGEVRISQHVHPTDFSMEAHVHPFHEICYVVAGRGRYETPRCSVDVSRGSLLCWSGRTAHRAVDERGAPLHQIIIIADDAVLTERSFYPSLSGLFARGEPVHLSGGMVGPAMELLVRRIASEGRGKALGREDLLAALVVELCVAVCRRLSESGPSVSMEEADPRIGPVLRDIAARYYYALTPETYARTLGISVRRFSELFRRGTGRTFTGHLAAVRIERARELLLQTDDKVVNIAFEVGYGNLSHFNRTFKKLSGHSPLDFRKAQASLP